MGFGEHQVGLGGLLGWIYGFWVFLSFLGVILFLFGVFFMCFVVSIGFVGFSVVIVLEKFKLWVLEKFR